MQFEKYFKLLKKNGQEHILQFWDEYSDLQKREIIKQIDSIDFPLLEKLVNLTSDKSQQDIEMQLDEAETVSLEERKLNDDDMQKSGEQILRSGKVGAFLVAGGQGSRLGFEGPKGAYPITPVKKKTLFQLHAEKILAMSGEYGVTIPWYIMTSTGNHSDTISFFKENNFFGLAENDVMFFSQDMLPAVDKNGKLMLEAKDRIFMSPNGHGGSLKALWDSGAYLDLVKRNIEYLFYFQVDNVLVNICDPVFLGYHKKYNAEMSSKVVRKAFPEEKMGIICKANGKTGVVEYSDLSDKDMYAETESGELKYWAGSIAIHFINTSFIEKENKRGFQLPYHVAQKNIPFIDSNGQLKKSDEKNGYKFETFVFDALAHCENTITLEVKREDEFSALKNKEGIDSEETAIRDMKNLYLSWMKNIGIEIPENFNITDIQIEISPLFAFSEQILKEKKEQIPPFSKKMYLK
ncbi:MAG: UDPGP type 1 family protein [Calditrichaeota bacterium]|nr:UDPGP type 1 family protein [Calditrichota bacterium]